MHTEDIETAKEKELARWEAILRDEAELLQNPGHHHKALIVKANTLHREQMINSDELSDLLEQADGALAYAVEALIDQETDDQGIDACTCL